MIRSRRARLGVTAGLAVLSGIVFGLAPALGSTRPDLVSALKGESPGRGRLRAFGLRNIRVVVQVALSLVLLVSAGLFIRSFRAAQGFHPGFDARNVLVESYDLYPSGYKQEQGIAFDHQVLEHDRALAGGRGAAPRPQRSARAGLAPPRPAGPPAAAGLASPPAGGGRPPSAR